MLQQVVIAKTQFVGCHPRLGRGQTIPVNLVLRHGFCDFENDGCFNPDFEDIVEKDFEFSPDISKQDWLWNNETFEQRQMSYCSCSKLACTRRFIVNSRRNSPPTEPSENDAYIIESPATGAWSGHDGELTLWLNEEWAFILPKESYLIYVADEKLNYSFGGDWRASKERFALLSLANGETWIVTHSKDITYKRIVQVYHEKLDTDTSLDFDEADEVNFTQEDVTKTSFEGDSLHLEGLAPAAYAQWHLNENSGAIAADSSGNSRDGTCTNMEDADWVPGKLNNCLRFNEGATTDEYVDCGNVADFELSDKFSFEFWIKILGWNSGNIRVLWKYDGTRGYLVYVGANRINVFFLDKVLGGYLQLHGSTPINLDNWYHVVVTYDGSGLASGVEIYVNGNLETKTVLQDTISGGNIATNATLRLGGTGVSYYLDGYLDEVLVYDVEISQAQVTFRWNDGAGTEVAGYPIGNWYVHTVAAQIDTSSWASILSMTLSQIEPANTQLRFLLSVDGRTTWKKWNGVAWTSEVLADIHTNGNTKAELEALGESDWDLLFSSGTLDVAVGLKTTNAMVTPDITQISIGYSVPGKYKCRETEIDVILDGEDKTKIKNISGHTLNNLGVIVMT